MTKRFPCMKTGTAQSGWHSAGASFSSTSRWFSAIYPETALYFIPKYVRGLSMLAEKHRAEMQAAHPHRLARHYTVIAGHQRRMGDVKGARASLAAAARVRPFSLPIRLRQLRLLGVTARRRT